MTLVYYHMHKNSEGFRFSTAFTGPMPVEANQCILSGDFLAGDFAGFLRRATFRRSAVISKVSADYRICGVELFHLAVDTTYILPDVLWW